EAASAPEPQRQSLRGRQPCPVAADRLRCGASRRSGGEPSPLEGLSPRSPDGRSPLLSLQGEEGGRGLRTAVPSDVHGKLNHYSEITPTRHCRCRATVLMCPDPLWLSRTLRWVGVYPDESRFDFCSPTSSYSFLPARKSVSSPLAGLWFSVTRSSGTPPRCGSGSICSISVMRSLSSGMAAGTRLFSGFSCCVI